MRLSKLWVALAAAIAGFTLSPEGAGSPVAAAPSGPRLVVYLEVPEGSVPDVTLRLSSLVFATDRDTLRREPLHRILPAAELAGRQTRLFDATLSPGILRTLILSYEAIEARVGAAPVSPSPPAAGTPVALDLSLDGERAALISLRWTPRGIDPEAPHHEPRIELNTRPVPPLGSLAFVSNEAAGYLTVVDPFSAKVVDVIQVGDGPRAMAYSPRHQRLYVALAGSHEIVALNALSRQVLRRVPLRLGDEPTRLLLADDDDALYVLNTGTDAMSVLTTESLQEVWRVPLRERPRSLAYDPTRRVVYVSSEYAGRILAYDTTLQTEMVSLSVDSSPTEILFSDPQGQLYVASSSRRRLLALDVRQNELAGELSLCGTIDGLAYSPSSGRLYAALGDCREIAISIPDQSLEVGSIRLPGRPGLMAFDSRYRQLLVTLPEEDQVGICNVNASRLTRVVEVGSRPYDVVIP